MIIQPISMADAVGARLRTRLFSGQFAAGTELRDTVLAKELGVARPTARVAVQRLIAEGLLERSPGHSARVRTFTSTDIADIYRVRRLLEFEAVRAVTSGDLSTTSIDGALADFERIGDLDSWDAAADADTAFHCAIIDAAGSDRLSRLFRTLVSEIRLLIAQLKPRYGNAKELYEEHAGLLRVLREGQTNSALDLWSHHLDDAEQFLTQSLYKENQ